MLLFHDLRQPLDDIRMLRGDVDLLGRIGGEVEQLKIGAVVGRLLRIERARRIAVGTVADELARLCVCAAEVADELPVAFADQLSATPLRELAVEERAGLLRLLSRCMIPTCLGNSWPGPTWRWARPIWTAA